MFCELSNSRLLFQVSGRQNEFMLWFSSMSPRSQTWPSWGCQRGKFRPLGHSQSLSASSLRVCNCGEKLVYKRYHFQMEGTDVCEEWGTNIRCCHML
jgi:hypothetical protein